MNPSIAQEGHVSKNSSGLSPFMALRLAWTFWILFLVAPFFLFLHVTWELSSSTAPTTPLPMESNHWFVASMAYLLVVVPVSFFARGHIFKAYWTGQPVTPGKYFSGMMSIWLALEIGGLFSLVGCLQSQQLLPDLLPALVAFMFFVTLWPSGRAMVRHTGHLEDPQMYEEPR
jgi:hypothetical protein